MPMLRALRTLNNLESGALSGAALQTQLADTGRLGDLVSLLTQRGQARRLAASSTAMTAVWASNTATDAVFASATARLAVYNSDTALAQLQYTPAQVARLDGLAVATKASTNSAPVNLVANGTKLILLRRYYSDVDFDYINWTRGSSSSGAGYGVTAGAGGRTLYTGTQARGCISGTYTDNSSVPNTNDATANFVAAANGLRRDTWGVNCTLYVSYILV